MNTIRSKNIKLTYLPLKCVISRYVYIELQRRRCGAACENKACVLGLILLYEANKTDVGGSSIGNVNVFEGPHMIANENIIDRKIILPLPLPTSKTSDQFED